ncbi:MAG: ACP S-malonyltransferase [Bacteroidales bacterium]|nr:ACP S-malonyltransferase [Bacteroidales bacterium]
MKAYVFPGQGAQFSGMGKDLYESDDKCREMFDKGNEILGFDITDIMFNGSENDLKQTNVTQPAIFLHSTILVAALGERFKPDMVAGHSLGEFSALVANRTLVFEDGLRLVAQRAHAMQKACEIRPSTMAAIIGLEDNIVEEVCKSIHEIVIPANYNSPGQVVISGSVEGVDSAIEILKQKGARLAVKLAVGGAFHSQLMEPARIELEQAINETRFSDPVCPVYQNVTGKPVSNPMRIRENLVAQLTSPVKWTQTVLNMIKDGADHFTEVGPGNVLQGLIKKTDQKVSVDSASKFF